MRTRRLDVLLDEASFVRQSALTQGTLRIFPSLKFGRFISHLGQLLSQTCQLFLIEVI